VIDGSGGESLARGVLLSLSGNVLPALVGVRNKKK